MSSRDRTAVVVEDDVDVRELVNQTLTFAGFEVHQATSGHAGIELVRKQDPDLITLDLGLPDLDGQEVCRRIRRETDAYVIMITARSDEIDQLMGLEIGADDYIVKPFSPRTLQARVAALFRRPKAARGQQSGPGPTPGATDETLLRRGPLSVDVESRLVRMDGQELSLTRTEFDLLATMLGAPRRVWTREALLRVVWGDEWTSDQHLVEVHVGNLRRKLGDTARDPRWVQTVRGVGYRMAPVPGG